jgi:pimeloyl-ACP methyl ester carboxylesterase
LPHDHDIYCLPGILARAEEQFGPVAEVISRAGTLRYIAYQGDHFDAPSVQTAVATAVRESLAQGRKVTLIGASLGGMMVTWVVALLRHERVDLSRLRIIIVDAPAGVATMKEVPSGAGWFVSGVTKGKLSPSLNAKFGKNLLAKMVKPPRLENIDVPDGEDPAAYKQRIIDESMAGMAGHKLTMYWSQLGWMTGHGGNNLPLAALDHVEAIYVACVGPNETIKQPATADVWWPHVDEVYNVPTAHCAFREQQPVFVKAFEELLFKR